MKSLKQIDPQCVGSICIDSTSYCSIFDVFNMNNLISDIRNILTGKRTIVGKIRNDDSKKISIRFCEAKDNLIGIASSCGIKVHKMIQLNGCDTTDFAWCYIGLLDSLARNIRCKMALSTIKGVAL